MDAGKTKRVYSEANTSNNGNSLKNRLEKICDFYKLINWSLFGKFYIHTVRITILQASPGFIADLQTTDTSSAKGNGSLTGWTVCLCILIQLLPLFKFH